MLSLTRIRNNPDLIKAGLEAKNESINLDEILKLEEKHRDNIHQLMRCAPKEIVHRKK